MAHTRATPTHMCEMDCGHLGCFAVRSEYQRSLGSVQQGVMMLLRESVAVEGSVQQEVMMLL